MTSRIFWTTLAVLLLLSGLTRSEDQAASKLSQLHQRLNRPLPPLGPTRVLDYCAEHLARVQPAAQAKIRYFDFSSVPDNLLPAALASLSFGCNSLHRFTLVTVPQPVPNTDGRIYWIDLDWYGWDDRVWENITQEDPYFREPIVPSGHPGLNFLRQATQSAGPVVRGDWFLFYTFDVTQFLANNQNRADDAFYYQLIYGVEEQEVEEEKEQKVRKKVPVQKEVSYGGGRTRQETVYEEREVVEKVKVKVKKLISKAPKTAAEFEAFWRVDFKLLRDFPVDMGAVVDEGISGVSFRNRVLWRVPSAIGVYWRTFDTFRSVGDQDFIESPFPREIDGGEHIFQDLKGAQFYLLSNGKGERVEFGDPRLVSGARVGHPAVITAIGCIKCHDTGILSFRNEHQVLQQLGLKLYGLSYERSERFRQFFLNRKLDQLVKLDQANYADFLQRCNGLTPAENAYQFEQLRSWYARPVDLQQAAREIGCTEKELEQALALGVGTEERPAGTTKGRLGRLVLDNRGIPRFTWERGAFQEAALLLLARRKGHP